MKCTGDELVFYIFRVLPSSSKKWPQIKTSVKWYLSDMLQVKMDNVSSAVRKEKLFEHLTIKIASVYETHQMKSTLLVVMDGTDTL